MPGQNYFQLISPLILLVFAGGFVAVGQYAHDKKSVRMFALSYFLAACAFTVDYFRPQIGSFLASCMANACYTATVMTFCAALFNCYRGRIPWTPLLLVAAAMTGFVSWYWLFDESIAMRTFVLNIGSSLMFLSSAISLRHEMRRGIDRVLQVLVIVNGTQLAVRVAVVLWYEGASLTLENYVDSVAAISLHFAISVAGLAIASALFVKFGMEIHDGLKHHSETDPLTGVLNRRGFENRIDRHAAALSDNGRGHVVVVTDIDGFKAVNDRFGHEAGDAVIRRFARILAGTARETDLVVRWGGEEFLILFLDTDIATAQRFAEAVRTVCEEHAHERLGDYRVTASFGIAAWGEGQSISEVCHLADKALYRAKREGRNRVCVHAPQVSADTRQIVAA